MTFSFFGKENEETILLLHIGSGSITGAFGLYSTDKKPKILQSLRLPLDTDGELDITDASGKINSVINDVLSGLAKHSPKISDALVVFSSPWFGSKTRQINLSEERPFFITREFLEDIALKEEDLFKKQLRESDIKPDSLLVIEKSITHTKVNGYSLDVILGEKTKIFEAFLSLAVVSKTIAEKVLNLAFKHFRLKENEVIVHTFPLVVSSVIRSSFDRDSNFVFLNIGEEVTSATLVSDNVLIHTATFPSGKNFILKQIGTAFNVSKEIAESTLQLYILDKTDDSTKNIMDKILNDVEKEWSIYFENAMLELSPDMKLPPKLYLTADSDVAAIFNNFIKLAKTDATVTYRENVEVVHIDQNILSSLYEVGNPNLGGEILGLMAIFFNMFRKRM